MPVHWHQLGTEVVELEGDKHLIARREESLDGALTPYICPAFFPPDLNHCTVSLCQNLQVIHHAPSRRRMHAPSYVAIEQDEIPMVVWKRVAWPPPLSTTRAATAHEPPNWDAPPPPSIWPHEHRCATQVQSGNAAAP